MYYEILSDLSTDNPGPFLGSVHCMLLFPAIFLGFICNDQVEIISYPTYIFSKTCAAAAFLLQEINGSSVVNML